MLWKNSKWLEGILEVVVDHLHTEIQQKRILQFHCIKIFKRKVNNSME